MNSALNELNTMSRIMNSLMPDCDELKQLTVFLATWKSQLMYSVRKLLLMPQPPMCDNTTVSFQQFYGHDSIARLADVTPLPFIVVKSLAWLVEAENSELFKLFWQKHGGYNVNSLQLPLWRKFLASLLDGSLKISELDSAL